MSGVGSEVLCVLSGGLDTSGREVDDPALVIAERVARRWFIERGTLEHAKDVGLGLHLLQNADLSPSALRRVELDAQREAMREDGVTACVVSAVQSGGEVVITGRFTINTDQEFTLTASSSGAAEVLGL
jgi:hypothetical protein